MTTIKILSNEGEAGFLLSVLKGRGFDAVLIHEGPFQFPPEMASVKVQVPDEQAAAAIELLTRTAESQSGVVSKGIESEAAPFSSAQRAIAADSNRPPVVVIMAIVCLALSYCIWLIPLVARKPSEPWALVGACSVSFLTLYALYRGWKLVRLMTVLMPLTGPWSLIATARDWDSTVLTSSGFAVTVLQIAAAVLLLMPAANHWFHGGQKCPTK